MTIDIEKGVAIAAMWAAVAATAYCAPAHTEVVAGYAVGGTALVAIFL